MGKMTKSPPRFSEGEQVSEAHPKSSDHGGQSRSVATGLALHDVGASEEDERHDQAGMGGQRVSTGKVIFILLSYIFM